MLLLFLMNGVPQPREVPLFDFLREEHLRGWYVVTDGVVGGGSRGNVVQGRGKYAVFSGLVSDSGGFASLWSRDAGMDLSRFTGLALRVRGDGKTYRVALKMSRGVDAIQYMGRITPLRSGWSVIRIRFNELTPMFRGTILNDARPFDPTQTVAVGLMIADRQEGAFELMIERISAYAD
jgi:monofunctional biosynthetic peptidoglycan transglycosylase